ncbi:MAG TPA: hypothetical protein VME63_10295 [Dyella sp.]|uniref:hypothetical protein n=1 Tax=Dyella sp. TaxID=1869338 RepID=UPI002BCE7606|nr:hypothetical protein [Dyella sp.]HTV85789.1 hypothetical protein [Dyella sp.]
MTERERNANQSLRALDEAHRLGRLSREEYRSRRRHLLSALRDSHVVTARNAIVRPAATPPSGQHHERVMRTADTEVLSGLFTSRRATAWKLASVLAVVVLVCALLAYWLLRSA